MDSISVLDEGLQKQKRIEEILVYARTFRKHPLILVAGKEVSPYDLACNGFVNKNFKEEQKMQETNIQQKFRQLTCVCRVPQCSKTLRFNTFENQKVQNQDNQEEIQTLLTEHQENCKFKGNDFKRLSVSELYAVADLLFEKVYSTFRKGHESIVNENIKINWKSVEELLLSKDNYKGGMNIFLQCYKKLDHKFCISTKKFNKSILLPLFGWKLHSVKESKSSLLKCHFCSKKSEIKFDEQFDFFQEHNLWCMIRKKQYEMWKVMLKKKYTQEKQEKRVRDEKTKQFILPKTEAEIESKKIREQLFQAARPSLQKIDKLLEGSLQFVNKQRHLDEEFYINRQQESEKEQKDTQYQGKYIALDEISKKCQQIIKNFINSIQSRRI